eukprot:TRINITY_DN4977_c0_g1_i1.p1 TRINITY_DN4977_c0_g1~~TRINITY_DN4977_c0_g1_i1.p1  ORF type:complete len:149 (-),score=25.88 TRINITY_DN4977_c0_g1_i1:81-527(-)
MVMMKETRPRSKLKTIILKLLTSLKFECTASPSDLLTRLQGICAAKKFAYKKYEDEPAALIITPNNIEGVVFMAQIFKKKNDKAESKDDEKAESKEEEEESDTLILELTRLKGAIREYMSCYAQISLGLGCDSVEEIQKKNAFNWSQR